MIEKMAMGLVDQMAEEKMIDKEAEEYYVYTLVSLMEKFITIGTILLISVLIEKLVPTAFFLLFFLSLRKRTGGYHMNTFFQCYLGTVVTYMLVLGLCMVLVDYPQLVFGLLGSCQKIFLMKSRGGLGQWREKEFLTEILT